MPVLGPVFWHDLVRIARRQRVTLWRVVYAGLLLAAILLLYVEKLPNADLFSGGVIHRREQMAEFANAFLRGSVAGNSRRAFFLPPGLPPNALARGASRKQW